MAKVDAFSVAAVIPLYNKEAALGPCIASVLHQTRLPDELIVVDDGSSDGSRALCDKLLAGAAPSFPWRVVTQGNTGASAARNRGASLASARFIAFLDADDEWLPGHLEEIERLATNFPAATFLSTHSSRTDGQGPPVPEPTVLSPDYFGILHRPLAIYARSRGIFRSPSVAIRRDAWDRSGGFPAGVEASEDVYLWVKLCLDEVVAHSGKPLVIVHSEHSRQTARSRLVGHQFRHFLGTSEGRALLSDRDLAMFLGSSLLAHIKWRRTIGDTEVMPELVALARALPRPWRIACLLAARAPLWSLRAADRLKERLRGRP